MWAGSRKPTSRRAVLAAVVLLALTIRGVGRASPPSNGTDPDRLSQIDHRARSSANVGFLNGGWRDALALIGSAGFALTAVGVWLAYRQMQRTTNANQAATSAALKALDEGRKQYNRYVIAQASRLLSEIRVYVKRAEWDIAGLRLSDLADLMVQVAGDDPEWGTMAERLHGMEGTFDRLQREDLPFSESLKGKWHKLQRELRTKIAQNYGPFPVEEQEHDDDR